MVRIGNVIENPITGERVTFLKTSQDTNGELLQIEWTVPPRWYVPEHVHPRQEECHEVLSGMLWSCVGGYEQTFSEGQRVVGPPRVPHAWRNPSDDKELRLLSEIRPPLRFQTLFETGFGLARDGKTSKRGIPKNPLQLAVLVSEVKDDFYFTKIPMLVQRVFLTLVTILASVGRWFGYRARYSKYSGPD